MLSGLYRIYWLALRNGILCALPCEAQKKRAKFALEAGVAARPQSNPEAAVICVVPNIRYRRYVIIDRS